MRDLLGGDEVKLRVASFNVRNGLALDGWNSWLPFRWLAAKTVVRHLDADLLGLQEAYAFQAWCLRPRGFGKTGDGRNQTRTLRLSLRTTGSSTRNPSPRPTATASATISRSALPTSWLKRRATG